MNAVDVDLLIPLHDLVRQHPRGAAAEVPPEVRFDGLLRKSLGIRPVRRRVIGQPDRDRLRLLREPLQMCLWPQVVPRRNLMRIDRLAVRANRDQVVQRMNLVPFIDPRKAERVGVIERDDPQAGIVPWGLAPRWRGSENRTPSKRHGGLLFTSTDEPSEYNRPESQSRQRRDRKSVV